MVGGASDEIAPRSRHATCAAENCGAFQTERDRFCSSDAGAIDAAEGGPAHNAGVTPPYDLASGVCLVEPGPSL